MTKWISILSAGLLGLIFVEVWIGFPRLLEDKPKISQSSQAGVAASEEVAEEAEQKMQGIHLVETRSGAKDWELYSETAEGYKGRGTWILKKVKVFFYNQDEVEFIVHGEEGTMDTRSKNMRIQGKVTTQSKNGYKLTTDAVEYDADRRELTTPSTVKVVGPAENGVKGISLTGEKLVCSADDRSMKILGGVTGEKYLETGKKVTVKSRYAELNTTNQKVTFRDDVSMQIDSLRLEGPSALFEYDPSKGFLDSILISGGVKVMDRNKFATAEMVKYEPLANQFIFSGNPTLMQNNDELKGEKIIFLDGGKKVKVEKIKATIEQQ